MTKEKCQICLKFFYTGCRDYTTFIILRKPKNEYCHACSYCIHKENQYLSKLTVQKDLINSIQLKQIKDLIDPLSLNVIKTFL